MRSLESAFRAALASRSQVVRWFLWVTVEDFDTGAPTNYGWWTGAGRVTANVKDPINGGTVARQFRAGGALASVGKIRLTSDLTIRTVDVVLSGIDSFTEAAIRGHSAKQAPMQLHAGLLGTSNRGLVSAAEPMFVGYVDETPIETPSVNEAGAITLRCVSSARELTRASNETRSRASQRLRNSADKFYNKTAVVADWNIKWGNKYEG